MEFIINILIAIIYIPVKIGVVLLYNLFNLSKFIFSMEFIFLASNVVIITITACFLMILLEEIIKKIYFEIYFMFKKYNQKHMD